MTRHLQSAAADLQAWVEGCQDLAAFPPGTLGPVYVAIGRMVATVPRDLSCDQRAVARRQLDDAWQRLLAAVLPPAPSGADGRSRLDDVDPLDPRVVRALQDIERGYSDPRLRLGRVARQLAISSTHLTQLLKLSTGRTFGAHLHQRRVASACRLLAETTLSVKEIATRVGYGSTTQLDRHFHALLQRSPSSYRAGVRTALMTTPVPGRAACAADGQTIPRSLLVRPRPHNR